MSWTSKGNNSLALLVWWVNEELRIYSHLLLMLAISCILPSLFLIMSIYHLPISLDTKLLSSEWLFVLRKSLNKLWSKEEKINYKLLNFKNRISSLFMLILAKKIIIWLLGVRVCITIQYPQKSKPWMISSSLKTNQVCLTRIQKLILLSNYHPFNHFPSNFSKFSSILDPFAFNFDYILILVVFRYTPKFTRKNLLLSRTSMQN